MTENTAIEKGVVLLSEPFMSDPYFKRAVILMCEHHPQGSLGFILNKPTDMAIGEIIEGFPKLEATVYYGGPVHTDRLHYLHNLGDLLTNSLKIADGVYWGGDFSELQFLISNEMVHSGNVRFFVGCASWSGGQLAEEMETGSWVTAHMHPNYVFKTEADLLWKQVMYNKGNTFEIIADLPEESDMN